MPAATRQDYENIIVRLQGVGPLVDQTIALMERGLAAGMTPPRVVMRERARPGGGTDVERSADRARCWRRSAGSRRRFPRRSGRV